MIYLTFVNTGSDPGILCNSKKSLTMLFKPKTLKDLKSPPLYLCNNKTMLINVNI